MVAVSSLQKEHSHMSLHLFSTTKVYIWWLELALTAFFLSLSYDLSFYWQIQLPFRYWEWLMSRRQSLTLAKHLTSYPRNCCFSSRYILIHAHIILRTVTTSSRWYWLFMCHNATFIYYQPYSHTRIILLRKVHLILHGSAFLSQPCCLCYWVQLCKNSHNLTASTNFITENVTFKTCVLLCSYICLWSVLFLEYSDGLCCKLVYACPKVRPVVAFRELEINRDGIKLIKRLGAGHFGEVWAGKCDHYTKCEDLCSDGLILVQCLSNSLDIKMNK